ncbi:MAG: hypothetical protein WB643_10305 [Candidatus Bathyarchaeia archaeon]
MTTIYVRIPRNRWTPIGEIDLNGWRRAYHGWKTPIRLEPEIEKRMENTAALTLKIRDYARKHDVTTRHDRSLVKNRRHVKVLEELERRRWEQGTYKFIRDEFAPKQLKANKESREYKAKDEALASLYEKLDGNRSGWYWQKPEVRDALMKLPLHEAEEKMKQALQKKR